MHDTLRYLGRDPVHRRWHHGDLTFRGLYGFSENFVLPLSHDEVVHGKGSLLAKMHGDWRDKFAQLRLLYAMMYMTPGKKLLFMGSEIAPWKEWNHDEGLDWSLLGWDTHRGVRKLVAALNEIYAAESSLHATDFDPGAFAWTHTDDAEQSVIGMLRGRCGQNPLLALFNFTPIARPGYEVGVPTEGRWRRLLDTDSPVFAGTGWSRQGRTLTARAPGRQGRPAALRVDLPPLSAILLRAESAL
jgi:1,4-alpha-glucan branching enzyme